MTLILLDPALPIQTKSRKWIMKVDERRLALGPVIAR